MDWTAVLLSLRVATVATLLSASIGFVVAHFLAHHRFPGKVFLESIVLTPLILPPTVLGYFLLVVLGRHGPIGEAWTALTHTELVFTWKGAAIAAAVAGSPLFIRQAQVALEAVDPDLESAARSIGASEWQVLTRVSIPLARRGLVAGVMLCFARALGEFGATLMVAGSIPGETRTLPLSLYDAVQAGNDTLAAGLSVLLAAIAIAASIVATRFEK